jgi:hypothetical protein
MDVKEAITAFSQSEKIKSSIIWVSQALEMFISLPEEEKPGAIKILRAVISMIGHEISDMRSIFAENQRRMRSGRKLRRA